MVQGIGGNSGSIKETSVYQTYYAMYQEYVKKHPESTIGFESWLTMTGYRYNFTQKIENYLETGNENYGDDSKDTLNMGKHVTNGNTAIYQSEDEETFYEFDWENGTYNVLTGKEQVAKALGLPEGADLDTLNFCFQKATITNYTFGDLEDGQNTTKQYLSGNYSGVSYVTQEFDLHYIFDALLMDPTDPQYKIAKGIFDDLCANINQWLPISEQQELDNIASEYGADSAEYKDALKSAMLRHLDQANEWIEEHSHVPNVNAGTLTNPEDIYNDGTVNDSSGSENTSEVPEYNKDSVIQNAGMSTVYAQKNWEGNDHYSSSRKQDAIDDAVAYADQILTTIINTLISELGENCTEEMKNYMLSIKNRLINNDKYIGRDENKNFLAKNGWAGTVKTQAIIDDFFTEFDAMCANNGKTNEQVQAEQKEQEKQNAEQKEAYKYFYNMNFQDIAKDAGIKDIQVVNASSAAEIKSKAETEILEPMMIKIKARLSGKGISDDDLRKIFSYATEQVLNGMSDWATNSNNYVYNIDSSKVVSMFESAVKKAINAKGYNF